MWGHQTPDNGRALLVLTREHIDTLVGRHKQGLGGGAPCPVCLVEVGGARYCLKVARERRLAAVLPRDFDILLDLEAWRAPSKPWTPTLASPPC